MGKLLLALRFRRNLHATLTATPLPSAGDTQSVMRQLLSALGYIHHRRIIHNDVKPQNVLVSSDFGGLSPSVWLCDFGSSLVEVAGCRGYTLEDIQQKGVQEGTRYYRAPEILCGLVRFGVAADIWSAGCILGQIMMGKVRVETARTTSAIA